jgi:hypothetical protein
MDANVLMKNELIGSYVFDAARIYYQKDHEMYRKWVAVINDENPECTGVQGPHHLSFLSEPLCPSVPGGSVQVM